MGKGHRPFMTLFDSCGEAVGVRSRKEADPFTHLDRTRLLLGVQPWRVCR